MPATAPITYPAQIADFDYTITQLMFASNNFGPHHYAGRLYIVAGVSGSPNAPLAITVFRSIDNGLTWQECDTANRKVTILSATNSTAPVGVQASGSDLIIGMNATMAVHRFSMYTSSWEAAIATGGPTVDDSEFATWLGHESRIFPARRSDGTVIAEYQTTPMADGFGSFYGRFRYAIYDAGWTDFSVTGFGPTDFWEEAAAGACLNEADDRFHVFFIRLDQVTFKAKLYHASVDSGGTMDSIVEVDSIPLSAVGFSQVIAVNIVSQPICVNGVVYIAYIRYDGVNEEVVVASATSGASPTFTAQVIPGLTSDTDGKDFAPDSNTVGNIFSLAFGGIAMGTLYSANPDDSLTKDGFRLFYLPFELLENDPSGLYLFTRVGGQSSSPGTNFVYNRRSGAGIWGDPVQVYSPYRMNSVIGARVMCECSAPTPAPAATQRAVTY